MLRVKLFHFHGRQKSLADGAMHGARLMLLKLDCRKNDILRSGSSCDAMNFRDECFEYLSPMLLF